MVYKILIPLFPKENSRSNKIYTNQLQMI